MKVSFILLAHEHPAQLKSLIEPLLKAGSNVYVHHDASSPGNLESDIVKWGFDVYRGNIYHADRVKVVWGEWSIVQATLNCLEQVKLHDTDSDYFMLISGSCMPIKPVELLEKYLQLSGKDHIEAVNAQENKWVTAGLQKQRWSKFHFFNWRYQQSLFDNSLKVQRKLKINRDIPLGQTPHMGSQWWCLRRTTVMRILSLVAKKSVLKRFYRFTWVPDELFFQTLVANLVPADQRDSELLTRYTFNSWGIPRVYYDDDYPELLGESKFFVRKVSHRADDLRAKLAAIAPMQVADYSELLLQADKEREAYRERLELQSWIERNRWHSLESHQENHYDYIKSIPNKMLVLIGSDTLAKQAALAELDKLDSTVVYGDLFDDNEVGAGYRSKSSLPVAADDTTLMQHKWHQQLGDIAYQHPDKIIVFSLGANALDYIEVLRWHSGCNLLMVDRDNIDHIDKPVTKDLYLKSKVLHLLEDRACELNRVSTGIIRRVVEEFLDKPWSVRSFKRTLSRHQARVRWPALLTDNFNHWDFLKAIYSKIIILVYDKAEHVTPIETYLKDTHGIELYHDALGVIPEGDDTLDWHYYLADLAHLNAKVGNGVLVMTMDHATIKRLDTLRWKRHLLVLALESEGDDQADHLKIEFQPEGAKVEGRSYSHGEVLREVDAIISDRRCSYSAVPYHDDFWLDEVITDFIQITPVSKAALASAHSLRADKGEKPMPTMKSQKAKAPAPALATKRL